MKYSVVTPATEEPITLDEAKLFLRLILSDASEDSFVESLITAAREYCENFTGRAIATQGLEMYLDAFPQGQGGIEIPMPPLQSVESIKYKDSEGVEVSLTEGVDYLTDITVIGRVVLPRGKQWPTFKPYPINPVTVSFTAGYTDDVPKTIKEAMLLLVGHWYENREAVVIGAVAQVELQFAVKCLLSSYKVVWF